MKTKKSRIVLSLVMMLALFMSGLFSSSTTTYAGTSVKGYVIGNKNVTVYSEKEFKTEKGEVYPSDECYFLETKSEYVRIKYPVTDSKGNFVKWKDGYAKRGKFLLNGSPLYSATCTADRVTTYVRPSGKEYGYVEKNDKVDIYGQTSDKKYTQIRYPVKDGFKFAVILTKDAEKYLSKGTNSNSGSGSSTGKPDGLVLNSQNPSYPKDRAADAVPKYINKPGNRSAASYNSIIDQFNVESRERYQKTNGSTWCNIFGSDVMIAMGIQNDYSHWLDRNDNPCSSGSKNKAKELTANATYKWLKEHGSEHGWSKVSASKAQQRANKGYPTIAVWYNSSSGGHGHIMVVRPETNDYKYKDGNPVIAQAGATNYRITNLKNVMGNKSGILYYTHD